MIPPGRSYTAAILLTKICRRVRRHSKVRCDLRAGESVHGIDDANILFFWFCVSNVTLVMVLDELSG